MNINTSVITKKLLDILRSHPSLQDIKSILRSDFVNDNPDLAPWIGIYRTRMSYEPRTLGKGFSSNWQGILEIQILVQEVSYGTGEETEVLLEDLVQKIMHILFLNDTIGGTVDMIVRFGWEYQFQPNMEEESSKAFFQMGILTLTSEVATG